MEAATCHIARLPEELLAAIISLTSPLDACRSAAISRAFLSAADSDAVWSRFLPCDLTQFVSAAERSLMALPSYKRMWVDRATGGKCYMLAARALKISWDDTPRHWRWEHLDVLYEIRTGKRIASEATQAAQLLSDNWLEIRGKIEVKMLSQNCTYGAYLVFRLDPGAHGLCLPSHEASVSIGGNVSTRRVCLHGSGEDGAGGVVSRKYVEEMTKIWISVPSMVLAEDNVVLPRRRADGWMELELADGFYIHEAGDGEVCVSLNETKRINQKYGLTVWSIEIRIKQQGI